MLITLPALLFLLGGAQADCSKQNVPVSIRKGGKDTFVCARLFTKKGNKHRFLGCQGQYTDILKGEKHTGTGDRGGGACCTTYFPIGSVIVNPGCTLHGLPGGESYADYAGGKTYPDGKPSTGWRTYRDSEPYGFYHLRCECEQTYIDCTPEDRYETIAVKDNPSSSHVEYTYTRTIGTTFTEEAASSKSIGASVGYNVEASFFGLFGSGLSISGTTGFDWTELTREEKSSVTETSVKIYIEPYKKVKLSHVVGHCGGNTINTHFYRIESEDLTRNG